MDQLDSSRTINALAARSSRTPCSTSAIVDEVQPSRSRSGAIDHSVSGFVQAVQVVTTTLASTITKVEVIVVVRRETPGGLPPLHLAAQAAQARLPTI